MKKALSTSENCPSLNTVHAKAWTPLPLCVSIPFTDFIIATNKGFCMNNVRVFLTAVILTSSLGAKDNPHRSLAITTPSPTPKKAMNITDLLHEENVRQQTTINLIASENYASPAVRAPLTSIAGSKYAEGYPGKRYYAGCTVIDKIEDLCKQELLATFVPEQFQDQYHANVQSHAGSQANFAVYNALLAHGDSILSMSLNHGGHLTHGHAVNFSGKHYTIHSYRVDEKTCLIDYDHVRAQAHAHKPKIIICGASAYARTIDWSAFRTIADEVGALLMADIAHIAGLVAGGAHPNPIPHVDIVTSTTHKTLRGSRGAFIICRQALAKKIDFSVVPGSQGGPFMHAIASKAIALQEAQTPSFAAYCREVVACSRALAHEMAQRGYHIVTGGSDTHLFLIDLSKSKGLEKMSGKKAEKLLEACGIILNRNTVPGDTRKPWFTSGIRIGTAAMVTRGCTVADMAPLADLIDTVLRKKETNDVMEKQVQTFAQRFVLP